MTYFFDTNIFLRTLIKEDIRTFNDCYKALEKIKRKEIQGMTAGVVLAEIVWTLSSYYNFSRKKTVQATQSIINLHNLKIIDDYDHLLAIEIFQNKRVKYIDALIGSIKEIQLKNWTIVSYDKDFDKIGIKRLEPSDIVADV